MKRLQVVTVQVLLREEVVVWADEEDDVGAAVEQWRRLDYPHNDVMVIGRRRMYDINDLPDTWGEDALPWTGDAHATSRDLRGDITIERIMKGEHP